MSGNVSSAITPNMAPMRTRVTLTPAAPGNGSIPAERRRKCIGQFCESLYPWRDRRGRELRSRYGESGVTLLLTSAGPLARQERRSSAESPMALETSSTRSIDHVSEW